MLFSGVQPSDSVIPIALLFQVLFHYRSLVGLPHMADIFTELDKLVMDVLCLVSFL